MEKSELDIRWIVCNGNRCWELWLGCLAVSITTKCVDSSVVERLVYTELVGGSNPSPRTISQAAIGSSSATGSGSTVRVIFTRRAA